jgi:hypothetical protein
VHEQDIVKRAIRIASTRLNWRKLNESGFLTGRCREFHHSHRNVRCMAEQHSVETHLLLAVLKIARDECASGSWEELEPILAAAWERLRGDDAPPWAVVAEEVQASCHSAGILDGGATSVGGVAS